MRLIGKNKLEKVKRKNKGNSALIQSNWSINKWYWKC